MFSFTSAFVIVATLTQAEPSASLVLEGDLVTMGPRGVIADGRVLIRNGRVVDVFDSEAALARSVDISGISRLATGGWIFPAFTNLHTHMPFNHQPLWVADRKFENRYQWWVYPDYVRAVKNPQAILYGGREYNLRNEQTLFAEARALIGGTTALTSSAEPGYYTVAGRVVRNLEYEPSDSGRMEAHVAEIHDELLEREAPRLREAFESGELRAWVAHVAEGIDERSREEFERLKRFGLLRHEVVIVHGVGLDARQLGELGEVEGHLVWAPTSNYILYGKMADVEAAMLSGVTVSLSNDWSPSGTHNLLAELKVAAASYESRYGKRLPAKTLVEMITVNPAKAIGWDGRAGAIAAGVNADLVVVAKRSGLDPYETVVAGTEEDVELVLVGGEPMFGRAEWMERFKPNDTEVLLALGRTGAHYTKRIDVTRVPGDMTLAQARARLRRAVRFDTADMAEQFLDVDGSPMEVEALTQFLDDHYPGLAPDPLPPIFLSNDSEFFERLTILGFPFTKELVKVYRP